jgi:hypothetical protein
MSRDSFLQFFLPTKVHTGNVSNGMILFARVLPCPCYVGGKLEKDPDLTTTIVVRCIWLQMYPVETVSILLQFNIVLLITL